MLKSSKTAKVIKKVVIIPQHVKNKKVKGRHLYTATYTNMTSSGLQCNVDIVLTLKKVKGTVSR